MQFNNLTTFNCNYITGSTSVTLNLSNNYITSLLNLSTSTSISYLLLVKNTQTNQTNVIPSGSNFPSSLTALTLADNNYVNWSTSFSGSPQLNYLSLRNCGLTQASVNFVMCDLTGTTVIGGNLILANQGSNPYPNNPPGATGLACKAILTGSPKNWTVTNA
jgi:hypothetical protein